MRTSFLASLKKQAKGLVKSTEQMNDECLKRYSKVTTNPRAKKHKPKGRAVFKCAYCNQTKPATDMLKIKGQVYNYCKDCFNL